MGNGRISDEKRNRMKSELAGTVETVITDQLIVAGMSVRGGWSREQFRLLGLEWKPNPGWKGRIIGKTITSRDAVRFLNLTNLHVTKKEPNRRLAHFDPVPVLNTRFKLMCRSCGTKRRTGILLCTNCGSPWVVSEISLRKGE